MSQNSSENRIVYCARHGVLGEYTPEDKLMSAHNFQAIPTISFTGASFCRQCFLEFLRANVSEAEVFTDNTKHWEKEPSEEITPGIYRHFKGELYRVLGVGEHTETHEMEVAYTKLKGGGRIWHRPLTMFQEVVEVEGEMTPRFQRYEHLCK